MYLYSIGGENRLNYNKPFLMKRYQHNFKALSMPKSHLRVWYIYVVYAVSIKVYCPI